MSLFGGIWSEILVFFHVLLFLDVWGSFLCNGMGRVVQVWELNISIFWNMWVM